MRHKLKLYILIGLSGAGKSTIAKEIVETEENTIIVSSDAIREELTGKVEDQSKNEEVFKIFHNRIRKGLENKHNVIADATNITMKARRAIMMKINGMDVCKIAYVIPKPFERCKKDNLLREHPVPEWVLDKQIRKFQVPFAEEGFDQYTIYTFHKENRLNEINMFDQMGDYDQQNPHHTMTLDNHCKNTYELFCRFGYQTKFNIAALLHDYGKLFCKTVDENGVAHFYSHDSIGSYLVLENMAELYCKDVMDVCFLINYHMMPFQWTSEKIKKKWKKRFGEYKYELLMNFNECDRAR